MAKKAQSVTRPQRLDGAAMNYAPVNELGVVLLFAQVAKKYRIRVDQIQAAFPDCIAYQTIGGREKQLRIEFEYRSKHFVPHGHDPKKCDMIVCWEHDWVRCPPRIRVLELRREFGLGFNVWIQPVSGVYADDLAHGNVFTGWSVAPRAMQGDLVLFYRTRPEMRIADVFRISGPVFWGHRARSSRSDRLKRLETTRWSKSMDHFAPIRRVCRLAAPVFLEDLRRDKILSTAGFVRGSMQGRPNASEYWPYLHDLIVRRNPGARLKLRKYQAAS
jgi:hypothetical protein